MSCQRTFSKVFFGLAFCVTGLCSFVASPASADAACDHAVVLDLDGTLRLSSLPRGEDVFLRVEIPGPGVLRLDASVPGFSKAEPVLVPVSVSCDGVAAVRPVVLERTLGSVLLGGESSGGYVFRLTSSDPSATFSTVKVRSAYLPFGEDEDEIENEPDPFAGGKFPDKEGEDEDEIENEPDPFAGGKLPDKEGEDEDEIENEPDPFADGGSGASLLCGTGETDDHGDTFACASTLTPGSVVTGAIDNDWGDDADVFRIVLSGAQATDLWRVKVAVSGDTEIVATLFDGSGERLSQADVGGSVERIRVLRPGVYFVRVEGSSQAEGSYRLKLDVSVL